MDEARRQWLVAYNRAYHRSPQRRGPLTDRTLEVLDVLLEAGGIPISYDTLATMVANKHGSCSRSTAALAVKRLRSAGLVSWEPRRSRVWRPSEVRPRWRVFRAQNVYRAIDPTKAAVAAKAGIEQGADD